MRTSPYSLDLRERVIKFIESGNSQQSAVELYQLNPSTINRWWLRYKTEGHYAPRARLGKKPRVNMEELKLYIASTPNFKTSDSLQILFFEINFRIVLIREFDISRELKV